MSKKFSPAFNRDKKTAVWLAQSIRLRRRLTCAPRQPTNGRGSFGAALARLGVPPSTRARPQMRP